MPPTSLLPLALLAALILRGGPGGDDPPGRVGPIITAVVEAPDGAGWLRGSQAGVVFRSSRDGRERAISASLDHVLSLAFSPDGSTLAVAGGSPAESGAVELRSWPMGGLLGRLEGHGDTVHDVIWLDGGKTLATAGADGVVRVWDLATRREVAALEGHSGPVLALAASPDGRWFCSGGADAAIRVWEPGPWRSVRSLNNHLGPVQSLAFRPAQAEGRPATLASAGDDATVRVWQPGNGRLVRIVRLPCPVACLAWTPDGARILTGAKDGHLRSVDGDSDAVASPRRVAGGRVTALSAAREGGKILVGTSSGAATVESERPP
jgi:WD40 repeat protein